MHHDIKADNILLSQDHKIAKICDFGESLFGKHEIMEEQGKFLKGGDKSNWTLPFASPEVWTGANFSTKADIWALGCTMLEMVLGYNRFQDPDSKPNRIVRWKEKLKNGKYKTKWLPKGEPDEKAPEDHILFNDPWTYDHSNPWNLMGFNPDKPDFPGVQQLPVLESMDQIKPGTPPHYQHAQSSNEADKRSAMNQAKNQVRRMSDAESAPKYALVEGQAYGLRGHSWMLALQNSYRPPMPNSLELGKSLYDFIKRCFTIDPNDRPSAGDLLEMEHILTILTILTLTLIGGDLLEMEYITGEAQIVVDDDTATQVPKLIRRGSSWLGKESNEAGKYDDVGFKYCKDGGAKVGKKTISSTIKELSNKKLLLTRRPFLLYALDVMTRNYLNIQDALRHGDTRTQVGLLYRVALNKGQEILKHISEFYSPGSDDRIMEIVPVLRCEQESQAVKSAWDSSKSDAPNKVVDGVRLMSESVIRECIVQEATFRVYNEYDLDKIHEAFLSDDVEDHDDTQTLKAIRILLPSVTLHGQQCGNLRRHERKELLAELLLHKMQAMTHTKEDIHFKVLGIHGYAHHETDNVQTLSETIQSDIGLLEKVRAAHAAGDERIVEMGGLEVHITGCVGLISKYQRSEEWCNDRDKWVHDFMNAITGISGVSFLKIDVGNDLLSEAVCLVDRVVGVHESESIVVMEEGPNEASVEGMPVNGLNHIHQDGAEPAPHHPAAKVHRFGRDARTDGQHPLFPRQTHL